MRATSGLRTRGGAFSRSSILRTYKGSELGVVPRVVRVARRLSDSDQSVESSNSASEVGQQLFVNISGITLLNNNYSYLVLTLLAAGFFATAADASFAGENHGAIEYVSLAENEDFWANVLRYVSYFFSVLLGTAYVAFKPIVALLKRPTTAIFVIAAFAGLYYFVSTTVKAMIGVDEFVYEPSSIVTPYLQ